MKKIYLPLQDKDIDGLRSGDQVLFFGQLYTARDAAHRRLVSLLEGKKALPGYLEGQVIYYCGPTPPPPGRVSGSAGPTTSSRMDPYTIPLLKHGIKGFIGKGKRSQEVVEALKRYRAVYFAAVGGAGAYLAKRIKAMELVAYADLGPEAVYRMEVESFPLIVVNDVCGNDLYMLGQQEFSMGW